jgi:TPR repeat protein
MMRAILVACLLCLSLAAFAGQSDAIATVRIPGQPDALSAGAAAYHAHNYAAAVADFRLAAQQGDAYAQFNLGIMYSKGHGVPQNYAKALKWYKLAAKQGDAWAQISLGNMYSKGQGVPQNDPEAYKWTALAKAASKPGSQAYISASRSMRILEARMTPAQIAQGQQEASAWWVAATRTRAGHLGLKVRTVGGMHR